MIARSMACSPGWTDCRLIAVGVVGLVIVCTQARAQADKPASPTANNAVAVAASASAAPTFEREIKPLFRKRCTGCHNARNLEDPNTGAGLNLETYSATLKGTAEHGVISAGRPSDSLLFQRLVTEDLDARMPQNGRPLQPADLVLVKTWIEQGAIRGEVVVEASNATVSRVDANRRVRRPTNPLDILIPTENNLPATSLIEPARTGKLEVVAKVGPLPAVTALTIRGDLRELAIGSQGMVVLWDLVDGKPTATVSGIPGTVQSLVFSRDDRKLIVSGGLPGRSGLVRIYDLSSRPPRLVLELTGHSDVVRAAALDAEERRLVSASYDHTARIWDLQTGKTLKVIGGHSDVVNEAAFSLDGKSVVTVSKDRSVKRFDAATGAESRTYGGMNEEILALAIRPDGKGFISSGVEPQLRWWEFDAERPEKTNGGHGGPVLRLSFSRDGKRLLSVSGDGTARIWDGKSGVSQRTLANLGDWQYAGALSANGALAATGGWNGVIRLWDADTGKPRGVILLAANTADESAEWLAVSPWGEIAGSASMLAQLRLRVGGVESTSTALKDWFTREQLGSAFAIATQPPTLPPQKPRKP